MRVRTWEQRPCRNACTRHARRGGHLARAQRPCPRRARHIPGPHRNTWPPRRDVADAPATRPPALAPRRAALRRSLARATGPLLAPALPARAPRAPSSSHAPRPAALRSFCQLAHRRRDREIQHFLRANTLEHYFSCCRVEEKFTADPIRGSSGKKTSRRPWLGRRFVRST